MHGSHVSARCVETLEIKPEDGPEFFDTLLVQLTAANGAHKQQHSEGGYFSVRSSTVLPSGSRIHS